MILNCLPFLWTPCKNVIQMFGIFKNCKYELFGVKLVILHNPFLSRSCEYPKRANIQCLGVLFWIYGINYYTQHWACRNEKHAKYSSPIVAAMKWHSTWFMWFRTIFCGLRGFSIVFPSGYCLWLTNWVILVLLTLVPRLVWQLGAQWLIVFVN